jgi:predicted dithiol-disulfide oxidoreductase (DUF899 family)
MLQRRIVSRDEWLIERKQHLGLEKAFTRLRDEVSRSRRALPWVKVDKEYIFEGPDGQESLGDLFEGRSQLIVYHFMFAPDWAWGCPSCSFLVDHIDGTLIHLAHRNVTLRVVSRAPLPHIQAFQNRMGWKFKWMSSFANDFNYDHGVSFVPDRVVDGMVTYNYVTHDYAEGMIEEGHGTSVFYKEADGTVYHTYSSYARGCDLLIGTYNYLDLVPKGRDEDSMPFSMAWLRHHDRYDDYHLDLTAGYPMPGKVSDSCCGSHSKKDQSAAI